MNGKALVFDINKVSLVDINEMIDKGVRFSLKDESYEGELTDVKEYLQNGKEVSN